jgi:hypothetical protein
MVVGRPWGFMPSALRSPTMGKATVAVMVVLAAVAAGGAEAGVKYVPMKDAAAVARSYQASLNRSGFRQRCKAVSPLLVRCSGMTATNDPNQQGHPWRTEIRKVAVVRNGRRIFPAERRIWMDGQSLGKPGLDPGFVRWARIRGW